ncbi:PTS transporter subunit EIIC [Alicyclobacillus dauci]|uniref:PTS transporter subunit EIIC n=1 Tax=Alicyclobacillus dauci TaxID=1475485 RepID=A0ABY6Z127_9BACL|nr:PTS transporter subunit EIIC [Alicyclobacillus dauci]WAH36066.1 PTS transporter subunit EIIC [Alicyclobacillus dauci]
MLGQLQRIGKALMLPIAVLPAAGLLLRLGQPDTLNIPFMAAAGNAVFNFLPVLFAIGVAVGFAKNNHGFAGLAGFLSYEILTDGAQAINKTINLDALGGILAGIITGLIFNAVSKRRDAKWAQFIGGSKGLAVVLITLVSIILALVFGYVWPYVQMGINHLGGWIGALGAVGAGIYGLLNRLLIPFGLHHVVNSYIWFVYGDWHGKTGDMTRFFAGDPSAGGFMAGMFPIMMFGLPSAALAMVAAAKPERRRVVLGIMGAAALTSFLTGVTEPIEFSFMFLAPALYGLHAVLTGLSLAICYALGIRDGFNFSAGLIDFVLNRNHATHGYWLIPIGIAFGIVYFVVFYFSIKIFNIKTPGREDQDASGSVPGAGFIFDEMQVAADAPADVPAATQAQVAAATTDLSTMAGKARAYLDALGGAENVVEIEACTTRLRLNLKDMEKLNEPVLKQLGSSGVIKLNQHNAQVVVGTTADMLVEEMKQFM